MCIRDRLYAERQRRPGFAFSPDSPWQTEFEEAFPYAETGDQLQAIADIKKDMEQPRPCLLYTSCRGQFSSDNS